MESKLKAGSLIQGCSAHFEATQVGSGDLFPPTLGFGVGWSRRDRRTADRLTLDLRRDVIRAGGDFTLRITVHSDCAVSVVSSSCVLGCRICLLQRQEGPSWGPNRAAQ